MHVNCTYLIVVIISRYPNTEPLCCAPETTLSIILQLKNKKEYRNFKNFLKFLLKV